VSFKTQEIDPRGRAIGFKGAMCLRECAARDAAKNAARARIGCAP
jgi:hypothetical protein